MNDNQDLRFECLKCGRCCSDEKTIVNLTYNDILRIKQALNLNLDEINHILAFYVFEKEPTEKDKKKMVISPIETERGLAFAGLRKKADGSCYFYDKNDKKCLIYNARPNFCRTFPFSFDVIKKTISNSEKESPIKIKYTEKGKEYCPGIGEGHPQIIKEEWLELGKKTIEDLNNNYYVMKKWNESVRNQEIKASVKNFLKLILNINNKPTNSE